MTKELEKRLIQYVSIRCPICGNVFITEETNLNNVCPDCNSKKNKTRWN